MTATDNRFPSILPKISNSSFNDLHDVSMHCLVTNDACPKATVHCYRTTNCLNTYLQTGCSPVTCLHPTRQSLCYLSRCLINVSLIADLCARNSYSVSYYFAIRVMMLYCSLDLRPFP